MCLLCVELSYLSVITCFNVFVVYGTLLSVCDVFSVVVYLHVSLKSMYSNKNDILLYRCIVQFSCLGESSLYDEHCS